MCACVRARVRACVRVRVCERARESAVSLGQAVAAWACHQRSLRLTGAIVFGHGAVTPPF